ncbi:MAG TPA: serine/threonine-protein kinase, partial [Nannocystaceae bacterium]|nr:serine/threonine-protein kinase [Nannocystaceae bacterium]
MSATSSTRRALWPHPFGELFEDSSRKPAAIVNVLWPQIGREPDALDYLERITGALASVESPFIAAMRGAGVEADGRVVVAYERVDGEGLSSALARGALPIERAVAVLRQLCRGLATAHAAGINHRALGPASIVLQRGGAHPDAIKILDFGLAGVLGETEAKYSPLVPMTPERLLGFGTHTSEDVYLVGCIGYWMLAGVAPFTGEDSDSLRRRHAIEDVAPLRTVARHVPPGLARVVEDALVKDPDDRTTDLAALELALVAAQREAGITTAWDSAIAAQSERAIRGGESPATSGVFQSVSGRGGKRSPSGSHRPVAAAANGRSIVAVGPAARAATSAGTAAVPSTTASGSKMPR